MKKCARVKNPCKICLQSVCNKNGIQCKGACKRWAHFSCLNYTPGKIQDIKAGIITVTCPCPTCNEVERKELPPFSCDTSGCPANVKPKCDVPGCPTNLTKPIPAYDKCDRSPEPKSPTCRSPDPVCSKNPDTCTKTDSSLPKVTLKHRPKHPTDENTQCAEDVKQIHAKASCEFQHSPGEDEEVSCSPPRRRNLNTTGQRLNCAEETKQTKIKIVKGNMSCMSGGKSASCFDISEFNEEINEVMPDKECPKSWSACEMSKESRRALLDTIQQLCNVVGHLSNQVKELVCRMKAEVDSK